MIHVLAFYYFVKIEDPELEVCRHKKFFKDRDVTARIYISHEGINGQMSASIADSIAYQEWMHEDSRFSKVEFKVNQYHEHVFPRLTVKVREQLVALDQNVDPIDGGERLTPKLWKEMLETKGEETLLLDVRNDYEWEVGHFEGADLPNLEKFRQFPEWARELKETRDPKKTRVMMYCTGGIRCELYSVLLKKEGFEQVFQLEGGVIKYGKEVGSQHWRGKLFVFDDRMAVPIAEDGHDEVISHCAHCETLSDVYYNCANMECNNLFLSCPVCAEKLLGCCSEACRNAERVRPYMKEARPKPFRKKHLLEPLA